LGSALNMGIRTTARNSGIHIRKYTSSEHRDRNLNTHPLGNKSNFLGCSKDEALEPSSLLSSLVEAQRHSRGTLLSGCQLNCQCSFKFSDQFLLPDDLNVVINQCSCPAVYVNSSRRHERTVTNELTAVLTDLLLHVLMIG
jgi:hypothetical protein